MKGLQGLCAATLLPLLMAQQDAGRFKIQSSTVLLDVIVTDSKGNVITGLTADDFRISENGAPQKIVSFEPPSPAAANLSARQPGDPPNIAVRAGAPMRSMRLITLVI